MTPKRSARSTMYSAQSVVAFEVSPVTTEDMHDGIDVVLCAKPSWRVVEDANATFCESRSACP